MKKFIAIPVVVLLLAVAILAAAFGNATSSAKTTPKAAVIKIGHIVDLTGQEASVGAYFNTGLKLAVANQSTIAGKQIQLIIGDSQGTPAGALDQAKKMVEQDGVNIIFGPTQQPQKSAVAAYCKTAKIPIIFYNPTPSKIYKNNKYVIAAGGSTDQLPTVEGNWVLNGLKWKKVTVLFRKPADGRAMEDPAITYIKKHGGKIAQVQYNPDDVSDYLPYFTKMTKSDGLLSWQTGSSAIAFWNAYYNSGMYNAMKVSTVFVNGMMDSFIVNSLQSPVQQVVNGSTGVAQYSPDSTSAQNTAFRSAVTASVHYVPDGISATWQVYDVFQALLTKTGGSVGQAKLLKALSGLKVTGPEGTETFAKGSQVANRTIYVVKVAPITGVSGKYQYTTVKTYKNVAPTGWK